jgi:hypothetical protein
MSNRRRVTAEGHGKGEKFGRSYKLEYIREGPRHRGRVLRKAYWTRGTECAEREPKVSTKGGRLLRHGASALIMITSAMPLGATSHWPRPNVRGGETAALPRPPLLSNLDYIREEHGSSIEPINLNLSFSGPIQSDQIKKGSVFADFCVRVASAAMELSRCTGSSVQGL